MNYLVAMLAATALIYGFTSGAYYFTQRPGMALTFVGYVIANVGLIFDAMETGGRCGP